MLLINMLCLTHKISDRLTLPANPSGQAFAGVTQLFLTSKNTSGQLMVSRLIQARHPNLSTNYLYTATSNAAPSPTELRIDAADVFASTDLIGATVHQSFGNYLIRDLTVTSQISAGSGTAGPTYGLKQKPVDPDHFSNALTFTWAQLDNHSPYWLEGKLWMLDAENEWFYEAASKQLYVKMPASISPQGMALMGSLRYAGAEPAGLSCINSGTTNDCSDISVSNIEVRETVSDGVFIKGGYNVYMSGVDVTRPGGRGVSMPGTGTSTYQSASVVNPLREGVWAGDAKLQETQPGVGLTINGVNVYDPGKDLYAQTGIWAGWSGTVSGSNVYRPVGIGISAVKNSIITGNYVEDACSRFSDCGAIYITNRDEPFTGEIGYDLNASITNNVVNRSKGDGIYLDSARLVDVLGNFVKQARHGIYTNIVDTNRFYKNVLTSSQFSELMLNELDSKNAGLLKGNQFYYNTFVHSNGSPMIKLLTAGGINTVNFGSFVQNRYVDYFSDRLVLSESDNVKGIIQQHTLASWQATGQDIGSTQFVTLPAFLPAAGAVPLISGWTQAIAFPNDGSLNDGDIVGTKLTSVTLDIPLTQINPGDLYLLSFDARSNGSNALVLGDLSAYSKTWAAEPASTTLTTSAKHYDLVMYAPLAYTVDRIQMLMRNSAGNTISIANLSATKAQVSGLNPDATYSFVNPGTSAISVDCPAANKALCDNSYVDAVTGNAVRFNASSKLNVPARSGVVIRLK
jgi:hypothetical protein